MSRIATFLITLWLSTAAAQFGFFKGVQQGLTNEAQSVLDVLGKAISFAGSTQCANIQKMFQVDYDRFRNGKQPDLSKVTLMYYTSAGTLAFNLNEASDMILSSESYNSTNGILIYIHGFTDNPTKESFTYISEVYIPEGKYNILALDASSLIQSDYLRSATNVRFIGARLGSVIATLVKDGIDRNNIHVIGHSLGAHIAGFAGKEFLKLTGSRIARITGLDPAGLCFVNLGKTLKLTKDDADFVDVIHTDGGGLGLDEQIGHVDFYPNSGSEQPNCLFQWCSHGRVLELYAESVLNPAAFVGVQCASWKDFREGSCDYNDTSVMGYMCPQESRGKYYLQTAGIKPYGLGTNGLKYNNNMGFLRNIQNMFSG